LESQSVFFFDIVGRNETLFADLVDNLPPVILGVIQDGVLLTFDKREVARLDGRERVDRYDEFGTLELIQINHIET
jgi:hypothetical protein